MKKQFFLMALVMISLSALSQDKKKTVQKVYTDTSGVVITDTTKIISIRDVKDFDEILFKIPHDQYIKLSPNDAIKEFYLWIMQRYQKPSPSKK